jgi:hypothetical protein
MFSPLSPKEAKNLRKGIPTILVPYRDNVEQKRSEQLKKFTNHMARYHPDWPVLVIEQSEGEKFNRGALLDIGARFAMKIKSDFVVFHDVDLIPLNPLVPYYTAFPEKPIHIGSAYKDKYNSDTFIGQVLSISIKDLKLINGFPRMFWGWGGEDDAMRNRMKKKGMTVWRPTLDTGFKVLEHKDTRLIPDAKNMRKWEDVREDTGQHGLNDVKWSVLEEQQLSTNIKKITVEIKTP